MQSVETTPTVNGAFVGFPKLARLYRDVTITEKIDGTNAQIWINEAGEMRAGSRNRYITPEHDNYGFAAWVRNNAEALRELGPGRHFGEWYGQGIQRNYGLTERRFALFHTGGIKSLPSCVSVVPTLYQGRLNSNVVAMELSRLASQGSTAVPGFMRPEGIVVFHKASGVGFKVTLDNDGHKGAVAL